MKKYFFSAIGLLALFMLVSVALAQETNDNLVKNGGFEQSGNSWNLKNTARIANDTAHNGEHSLYYKNTDKKRYLLFTQEVDVQPGQILAFSAWVKGKDLKGQGAGIFMQSQDVDKRHIPSTRNGGFPALKNGTYDWIQIKGEYHVPENAARTVFGLYLRKNSTGEAWFDDVEVRLDDSVKYIPFLLYPNFRGYALQDGSNPWRLRVEASAAKGVKIENFRVSTTLFNSADKEVFTQQNVLSASPQDSIYEFKAPKNLPIGDYKLEQTILSPEGFVEQVNRFPIHIVKQMPQNYVDEEGFSVINGKRFFPLGIYTGPSGSPSGGEKRFGNNARAADLKRMADAGLNTVLSYGYANTPISAEDAQSYLDLAEQNGLRVIYSVKDMYDGYASYPRKDITGDEAAQAQIEAVRNRPALLAWYLADERSIEWADVLNERYQLILGLDSKHFVLNVTNTPQARANSVFVRSTDILAADPYPIRSNSLAKSLPPSIVSEWINPVMESGKGGWQVLQVHNSSYGKLPDALEPPLDAMRNMSYQALIDGSTGIIYFAYHWLFREVDKNGKYIYSPAAAEQRWANVKKVIAEIKPLTSIITDGEKINLKVLSPSDVQYQAWEHGSKLYLMVANSKTWDQQGSLQLQIPHGYRLMKGDLHGIKTQQSEQSLQLELSPTASGVIILER